MPMMQDSSIVSGPTTTCSSTPPGVNDQANSNSTMSTVSDQATSSLTSSSVSKQAVNCFRHTNNVSSVQHIESDEVKEYLQLVSVDDYSGYLHVIENDADYLHVIDDNHFTVINETSCGRLDNVESHSNSEVQQQCCHALIEDEHTYQEIADTQANYVYDAEIDNHYDYFSYNEDNQAQATSTSKTSFTTTAYSHDLQQASAFGLSHNDALTGINNLTKQRLTKLLVLAAIVGAVLLACSVVTYCIVNATLRLHQASSPLLQKPANTTEAFGILRTRQDLHIINGLLAFDSVIWNVSSTSVDLTSSSLTAPQTASPSLYWMIIAVEVPIGTPTRVQLTNTNMIFNKSYSNNSDKDIVTKSGLVQLEPANVITVRSDYAVNTAYWSGFCLNNIMQTLVAIFVASSKQLNYTSTDLDGYTKIAYDTVIINEGNAWDTKNNVFTVPQTGIYVFSISIGFTSPHNPVAWLGVSTWTQRQNLVLGEAGIGQIISSNIDFVSTSRVLQLVEGATVEGMFTRAESIYSDSATLATSLSAFLYSPACNKQVLWSVAKTTSGYLLPPFENPLPYDSVRLNIGGPWLPSQNTVVIATPGIYYVFIAINVCDNMRATLWFRINEKRVLEIKSTMSDQFGQTRSNGAVIRLATGDRLTMEVANVSQTCLYGSDDGMNLFMGLLLTPASA